MSKASRRKRRKRKQRKQSNQHDRQAAPSLLDQVPIKAEVDKSVWAPADGPLGRCIQTETQSTLNAYRSKPILIARDANIENSIARGGYAHEQLRELIQNSADALLDSSGGRISLKLTDTHLYCADDGQAIGQQNVRELLVSHMSSKRGTDKIGRFGLGFKSVLGVTEAPEFFSQSGSFRFDRAEAEKRIRSEVPGTGPCPTLVLAFPMNPLYEMERDADLCAFMGWATNIVRLPLRTGAFEELAEQCETFQAEFLLLTKHVSQITIQTGEDERLIHVQREAGIHTLFDGTEQSQWKVYSTVHELSDEAQADRPDDGRNASINWAVPIDGKVEGKFWAYFPTQTASLLNGILNAPWKTSDDRQNLLKGVYNDELIGATAKLVATSIADLSSHEDPSRHLDALPRRYETGDNEHNTLLRNLLNRALRDRPIVPDQQGELRKLDELNFQPKFLTRQHTAETLEIWESFSHRPANWLHHSALTQNRLATIERLSGTPLLKVEVSEWLEQLVQAAQDRSQEVEASKAAIQAASKIREYQIANGSQPMEQLGRIVLTADGSWSEPDPDRLILGGDQGNKSSNFVHPMLEQCSVTRAALERLGFKPPSMGTAFKKFVSDTLDAFEDFQLSRLNWNSEHLQQDPIQQQIISSIQGLFRAFWLVSRYLTPEEAIDIIRKDRSNWRDALPVQVKNGNWHPLPSVLLPGEIVPGDGSRDIDGTVDTDFHSEDITLLKLLGAVSVPVADQELSARHFDQYLETCRSKFQTFTQSKVGRKPHWNRLQFDTTVCSGPLDPIETLSEESRVDYTWHLLGFDSTYTDWVMSHETQDLYRSHSFPSPAIDILRKYGMVRTAKGSIVRLSDGVGESSSSLEVAEALRLHPKVNQIRQAFDLQVDLMTGIEVVGEDEGVPIVDVWPALRRHLTPKELELYLVRCEGFRRTHGSMAQVDLNCIPRGNSLFVTQQVNEAEELSIVLKELNKPWHQEFLEDILSGSEPIDVRNAVEAVRTCKTDEERLLTAVGIEGLKRLLPKSLPSMLTERQGSATGLELARAAIAKFHTGALKAYKDDLQHLNPPLMWAGSPRAVRFVQSLGFDEDWAGHRDTKGDAHVEVIGPRSLPCLHPLPTDGCAERSEPCVVKRYRTSSWNAEHANGFRQDARCSAGTSRVDAGWRSTGRNPMGG